MRARCACTPIASASACPFPRACPSSRTWGWKPSTRRAGKCGQEGATPVFLHDFGLKSLKPLADVEAIKAVTEEALLRVARGEIENDAFNRLTPAAALAPDDVLVLRAYANT